MKSGKIAVMVLVLMLILLCLPLPVTAEEPEAQTSISSVPSTLSIGSTDWITLTVENVGDAKAEKMGIHFRVPPGLDIVDTDRSYAWGPSPCDGDTAVEWEWSGVSGGYSKSVKVEVKAVSSGAQEIKFRGYACSDGYTNCHDEVSCSSYPCTGCSYPSSKKKTIEVPAAKPQVTPSPVSVEDSVEIGGKIYCLEKGDLLFYESALDHIGMYSGDGKFIDAHLNNGPGVKKEQEIKGNRFDKPATQCYRVKTTQAKRNSAVTWAEEKDGKSYNLLPPTPCDAGDEWYCSELVYCAYKAQGITLGTIDILGYVEPKSIISDSDVKQVSPKSLGSVKTVQVSSNQPWTDTGLTVLQGDMISITASGTVIFADPHTPEHTTGPDGKPGPSGGCSYVVTDPSVPRNSLIGNIADSSSLDGKGFFVGSSFQGTVPIVNTTKESGKLFLGFNDGAVYCDRSGYDSWGFRGDNHGSFTATITITPPQALIPAGESPPTPTPVTPLQVTPTSTQSLTPTLDILTNADNFNVFLDTNIEVIDTVIYAGNAYHVVEYDNILPFACGIEIFSADGTPVTDSDTAKSVLTSVAWKEAANQLTPSDIDTLSDILEISQEIHSAVSPVTSATSFVIDKVDWLKNEACISITFIGKKCAWDAVKVSYPGISMLESELRSLNSELNEWEDASERVSDTLPDVISGFEDLKAGKEMSPGLQADIQESMSAFGTLKTNTDDMSSKLSDVISTLSDAERSIRSAAGTPVVGDFVSDFADFVGDLNDDVKSLKRDAQSFSSSLSLQSSKLSSVMSAADKKTNELHASWSSRQNVSILVYGTIGGIIAIILAIIGVLLLLYRRRRKGGETEGKEGIGDEAKKEEKEEIKNRVQIKMPKVEWDSRKLTGIIIACAGLFMLLYSFVAANNFVNNGFIIDETFGIRVVFLVCMIVIGAYLTGKGAKLTEDSKMVGIIFTPFGLFMLGFSFMIANTFVNGSFIFDESLILKIPVFICMIAIGAYLTGKGVTLIDYGKITGAVLIPMGVLMLLYSFITANEFVSGSYMADESFIIRLIFFICMIAVGGYLTTRGITEIMKKGEIK